MISLLCVDATCGFLAEVDQASVLDDGQELVNTDQLVLILVEERNQGLNLILRDILHPNLNEQRLLKFI